VHSEREVVLVTQLVENTGKRSREMPERVSVKLRDIKQNPFRNFEDYPFSEERISSLMSSIKKTGYWSNILGRIKEGSVELAYGHHRVEALKRICGSEHEVEIQVQDLTDEQMLKVMANENDEAYNCSMQVIDAIVKAARKYLEEHPELQRDVLTSGETEVKRVRIGAPMIANFLRKKRTTVELSLERIHMIENGKADPVALYQFPTPTAADNFLTILKEYGIRKEHQGFIVKDIISEGSYSVVNMKRVIELSHQHVAGEHLYQRRVVEQLVKSRFTRITAKMVAMIYEVYYLQNDLRFWEADESKKLLDMIPAEVAGKFLKALAGLRINLADYEAFWKKEIPEEALRKAAAYQSEHWNTMEHNKKKFAMLAKKYGPKLKLNPGELSRIFGIVKKRGVDYRRYTIAEIQRGIKKGDFYFRKTPLRA
jgi:hypothetical protein